MKTIKLKLVFCCLFFISIGLNAQTGFYFVKGILKDSLLNEPVAYATIAIARETNPEKAVKMLVTDPKGRFKEQLPTEGKYIITLSSVGNRTITRHFSLKKEQKVVDLGVLLTSEIVEELGGVTVLAKKPLVKAEIDKITYDVESDPDAEVKTVLDMLRKVPLVTVDGEDNIKLNGKTNFKIHLNGRPSNMLSNDPGKTLKSMPANSVKNIAVTTNPGAKYDAEGVGGIIDIITVSGKSLEGYTATFNAGASTQGGWNVGANAVVKMGKFSISGNYGHYDYRTHVLANTSTEYFANPENHYLNSDVKMDYKQPMNFGSIEASYEIDSLNLLTFTFSSYGGKAKHEMNSEIEMLDEQESLQYAYHQFSHLKTHYGGTELSLNYQRTLGKKDELLTFSYRYNRSPSGGDTYQLFSNQKNVFYPDLRTNNDAGTDEHTAQVDYVCPFGNMHNLEAGAKYIYRKNSSQSLYEQYDKITESWLPVIKDLSDFDHIQQIAAAYAAYTLKYKKFGMKVGTRLEYSKLQAKLHSRIEPDFDADFTDIVPAANLSHQLSETQTLKAGYNLRIARPSIWYLNPYRDERDPHSISYGNTHLKTEKYHNTELTFSSFTPKLMINASLFYSFSNNSIQQYYTLLENNVLESTYDNIGKQKSGGLNLFANLTLGINTSIWLNGFCNYTDLRSEKLQEKAHGWQAGGSLGFQQKLPWKVHLSGYGGYYGPDVRLQGEGSGYYYYGLTLSRSFLKEERFTVSVSANSFLDKYMSFKNTSFTKDFSATSSQRNEMRNFSLNLSYRIGDLKTVVKKIARGIQNDDVKSGGGGSQPGGTKR